MSEGPPPIRHIEVLVAPLVTFAAVIAMLLVARHYDKMPLRAPSCGFKTSFGIPCLSCGGTRSMRALSRGDFASALRWNPAVPVGILASVLWTSTGLRRYLRGTPPSPVPVQNRRILRNTLLVFVLLILNWAYLILYLP